MSTTTKNVAKAIAILSDVLSTEVENEPWTDSEKATEKETEETVALEDYEEVVEKSEDFSTDILDDLSNLREDLILHIENNEDDDEDYDSSFGEWDEEDDKSTDSDDDDSTASDAAPVTDAATEETESVIDGSARLQVLSESESDKIEEMESKLAELHDVITDAADTLNDIISNVEDFRNDTESW